MQDEGIVTFAFACTKNFLGVNNMVLYGAPQTTLVSIQSNKTAGVLMKRSVV